MQILFIGDIVGRPGRKTVKEFLPQLKETYKLDLVIANGENLSHGKGATLSTVDEMVEAGIDFFTSGNHIWQQKNLLEKIDNKTFPMIRPANYPPGVPGRGYQIVKTALLKKILIVNLMGRVFFKGDYDCPFRAMDRILEETKHEKLNGIIVDFHAEASSEKMALAHYLDGKVSALLGTHTHIQTADERIFPEGMAYISDIGMVGLKNSVIGVDTNEVIKAFLTQIPLKHEISNNGETIFNAVIVDIGDDGKALKIKRIFEETEVE